MKSETRDVRFRHPVLSSPGENVFKLAPPEVERIPVLFVSYEEKQCGVYQYGKNVFNVLTESQKYQFQYAGVKNLEEIDSHVNNSNCEAIIFNYHPLTLRFINPHMPRRYRQVNIALMHEMTQAEADKMPDRFFQHYVMGDPTLVENNPAIFKTGRLIIPYTNTKNVPDIVTIGTFGFSVGSKGYQRLIDVVQNEFDEAIIRIHIPSNGIVDANGSVAHRHIRKCQRRIKKPGIRIQASHEFLDRGAMLDFLAGNTLNAFLYDYLKIAGISSSPDHAMAVRRPMVITKSIMFRHLQSLYPPITIEDSSLREIIRNGVEPFSHLYHLWNEDNIRAEYENILDKTLDKKYAPEFRVRESINQTKIHKFAAFADLKSRARKLLPARKTKAPLMGPGTEPTRARAVKRFNRVLDNQARMQYEPVIKQLHSFAPEIMASKTPGTKVQVAFIFDAVRQFADPLPSPRILCVGSYPDAASAILKKLGYAIEEIDPEADALGLNAFFRLPSTVKGSYNIIFSISMIGHIPDDELFVAQIAELLAPGGVGLLTCDHNDLHKPGDNFLAGCRLYTQKHLLTRIVPAIKNCSLVDVPHWQCANPDFMFGGYRYTFATLAFRKNS